MTAHVSATLRIARHAVLLRAGDERELVAAFDPLLSLKDALREPAAPRDRAIEVTFVGGEVPDSVRAAAGPVPDTGAYVAIGAEGWIVSGDAAGARIAPDGSLQVFGVPSAPRTAEHVVIPALAERLRRDGVFLVHAAVVEVGGRAWLVPAARGSGKTTLALSLARLGATLRSDDRGFLCGDATRPLVDPWPEPPRVGPRTRFLLPTGTATGAAEPRTGKALAPSLRPARPTEPLPVAGVLLPRLVEGPGGVAGTAHGARVLAALASQAVVANDPATAAATLAWVARAAKTLPAFDVDVGSDPERLRPLLAPPAAGSAPRHGP